MSRIKRSELGSDSFRDYNQETFFRRMLRQNLDANLKLSEREREHSECVPKSLEPPDWR